jgi:hypothetical protein
MSLGAKMAILGEICRNKPGQMAQLYMGYFQYFPSAG